MKNNQQEKIQKPLGLRRQITLTENLFNARSTKTINCDLTTEAFNFIDKYYSENEKYRLSLDTVSKSIKDHKHDYNKMSQQCHFALMTFQDTSVFEKLDEEKANGNFLVLHKAIKDSIQLQNEKSCGGSW